LLNAERFNIAGDQSFEFSPSDFGEGVIKSGSGSALAKANMTASVFDFHEQII
jgi:hypothetical protein